MSYADGFDAPYYLACGCYSEWSDHRCGPVFSRCNGCGVPDDCYCHESCEPGNECWTCTQDTINARNDAHAEAFEDLAYAPVLRAGEVPGDAQCQGYPMGPDTAPWWWGQEGVWEWTEHQAGRTVGGW